MLVLSPSLITTTALSKSSPKWAIDAIAMELIPRTSRAQSMDVFRRRRESPDIARLSKSRTRYGRFFPMMMTSAGSSKACKLAVLGVGVAGLQAIATARRLGAMVEAYDVRKEVKEQMPRSAPRCIEIDVGEEGSGTGGYARGAFRRGQEAQQAALTEKLKTFDVIISTANIPGRKSPTLMTEEAVKGMRAGSVIVDMAAANGGNCPLTRSRQNRHQARSDYRRDSRITRHSFRRTRAIFFAQNLVNLFDILWKSKEKRPHSRTQSG